MLGLNLGRFLLADALALGLYPLRFGVLVCLYAHAKQCREVLDRLGDDRLQVREQERPVVRLSAERLQVNLDGVCDVVRLDLAFGELGCDGVLHAFELRQSLDTECEGFRNYRHQVASKAFVQLGDMGIQRFTVESDKSRLAVGLFGGDCLFQRQRRPVHFVGNEVDLPLHRSDVCGLVQHFLALGLQCFCAFAELLGDDLAVSEFLIRGRLQVQAGKELRHHRFEGGHVRARHFSANLNEEGRQVLDRRGDRRRGYFNVLVIRQIFIKLIPRLANLGAQRKVRIVPKVNFVDQFVVVGPFGSHEQAAFCSGNHQLRFHLYFVPARQVSDARHFAQLGIKRFVLEADRIVLVDAVEARRVFAVDASDWRQLDANDLLGDRTRQRLEAMAFVEPLLRVLVNLLFDARRLDLDMRAAAPVR